MSSTRKRPRSVIDDGPRTAAGYTRCSTAEQSLSGAGLADQRRAIRIECERRVWTLDHTYADEGASGRSIDRRPALQEALDVLAEKQEAVV